MTALLIIGSYLLIGFYCKLSEFNWYIRGKNGEYWINIIGKQHKVIYICYSEYSGFWFQVYTEDKIF